MALRFNNKALSRQNRLAPSKQINQFYPPDYTASTLLIYDKGLLSSLHKDKCINKTKLVDIFTVNKSLQINGIRLTYITYSKNSQRRSAVLLDNS